MDIGILSIFLIFLFIDILMIYKPIPIVAFPMMLFFLYVGIFYFFPLSSSTLPLNPITSVLFLLFCSFGMVVNAIDFRRG